MESLTKAIIGKTEVTKKITYNWINIKTIELPQEYGIIFLTDLFFEDIVELYEEKYKTEYKELIYFTTPFIQFLQYYSFHTQLVYLETEYEGYGRQAGVLFENGKTTAGPLTGDGTINQLLHAIGVWKLSLIHI